MKVLKLIAMGVVFFLSNALNAQVVVNVNVGSPPQWGPVGYTDVRYYYLPDVEAYYDIQTAMFIYYGGGVWLHKVNLPASYRYYDLYNGYKVVMTDYRGNQPYSYFKSHKAKYSKGYRGKPQKTIGEKPGKGNSNAKAQSKDMGGQHSGKSAGNGNKSGDSHNNNKNANKGHGNGGGHGKKK